MCFYDRVDYDCGHNEWGKMKMQCTRYWQKCCIRKSHDAYVHTMPGLCHTCVNAQTIKSTDTLDLTIRINPAVLYTEAEASYRGSINGEAQKVATHQTPDMLKAHINECIQEYQRINNLPRDSIEILDKANRQQQQQGAPIGLGDCVHPKVVFCSRELKRSQVQMMYLEEQNRRRCALIEAEIESKHDACPGKHTPNEYERILAQLERQNVKRLRMARQAEAEQKAYPETPGGNVVSQDYQVQLMRLESVNRASGNTCDLHASKDKLAEYQYNFASEGCQPDRAKKASTQFLSDHEPQLRLLEQQQKRRLEQQKSQRPSIERGSPSYYEEQLRLIEEQNKKRLLMARSEQDYIAKGTKLPLRNYSAKDNDKQPANQESDQIMEIGQALACQVGETSAMEQSIFEDSDMEILEKESI